MRQLQPLTAKPVLRSSKWMTQKANMDAKGRTSVKDRVAVRLVTTVARPKTLAKARAVALPTAASLAFSYFHNLYPPGSTGRCRDKKGAEQGRKRTLFKPTLWAKERLCLQTPLTDILI